MRYRYSGDEFGGHVYADDPSYDDRPLVHVFRDDELDELARHLYADAHEVEVDELDELDRRWWERLADILRNHGR